jgi:hypothetical protein
VAFDKTKEFLCRLLRGPIHPSGPFPIKRVDVFYERVRGWLGEEVSRYPPRKMGAPQLSFCIKKLPKLSLPRQDVCIRDYFEIIQQIAASSQAPLSLGRIKWVARSGRMILLQTFQPGTWEAFGCHVLISYQYKPSPLFENRRI